ncbi:MAG: hypothetical protein ACXU8Z_10750 [Caulobacteraceae bacterium]
MRTFAVVFFSLLPTLAHGQDAVWRKHPHVICVGSFRQECATRTSVCTRKKSEARWEIDFPRRSIRYLNARFSERIVALQDNSGGLSESALLDSGRLLRFHPHDEEGTKFEASMLETNTGDVFAFSRFQCRAINTKASR